MARLLNISPKIFGLYLCRFIYVRYLVTVLLLENNVMTNAQYLCILVILHLLYNTLYSFVIQTYMPLNFNILFYLQLQKLPKLYLALVF